MATEIKTVPCFLAFELHEAGERANERGDFDTAAKLFYAAAKLALTPTGALVLLEKGIKAEELSSMMPRYLA